MKPRIFIRRSRKNQFTYMEVSGCLGEISIKVTSHLNARQRRAIALGFFRQIRPFLKYFRTGSAHHSENQLTDFFRNEARGLIIYPSEAISANAGRIGFAIRMQRLEMGLTQEALARRSGIIRSHLSKMERGLCLPRRTTFYQLERVLKIPLISPTPPRKAAKATIAQRLVLREADPSASDQRNN
jgi:DNA-binding XRE family transcriptional regulator